MKKMLKSIGLLMLVVLVGCSLFPGSGADPSQNPSSEKAKQGAEASPWVVVYQSRIEQPVRLAAFMDASFGLTGGANVAGKAHVTTDGGQTWNMSSDSSGCLFSLDIIDKDVVWECNFSDVRPSLDGGKTWLDKARGMGQPGCTVSAVDRNNAWHLTPSKFEMTQDGGETRSPVYFPEGVSLATTAAISLRTPQDGYLLATDGMLYVTADGGQTWAKLSSVNVQKYDPMKLEPFRGLPNAAIRFTDARRGMLVLSLLGGGSSKVIALHTRDKGQTWSEEEVPTTIGQPYISRDGSYLTMTSWLRINEVTLLHYEP